jgi:hypothetical protein
LGIAVSDTIKEVQGIKKTSLESRILSVGKIFIIRWVASSFRTISAVWNNYVALHKHFQKSSIDNKRDGKERS